jgi:hypothetical protein
MGTSKFTLVLLVGLFISSPMIAETNSYTLEDAIKRKLVTAEIIGRTNPDHAYYGECINIRLKNTSGQNLSLNLESGRRLNCDYDSVQDMMITKSEIFALLPSQTKEFVINAMCCEKSNRSPSNTTSYNLGAMADATLVQLARLIENLNAQDYAGQHAVWVITDGVDPEGINGSSEAVTKALREFVINAINGKTAMVQDPGFIYDYSYPKTDGQNITVEGDFTWEMPYQSFVSLYIYDNSGNRVCVIFQDAAFASGMNNYHYKITTAALQSGGLYWIRMKQSNKTLKELAITMD